MSHHFIGVLLLGPLFFLLLFSSCANLKSGQYVILGQSDSVAKLSKEFDIPPWELESVNKGKNFSPGEWIFIPLKRGILPNIIGKNGPSNLYSFIDSGEFIWPVPSSQRISSGFGFRWGREHNGIDIAGRVGSHILSTGEGTVVYAGREYAGFGNMIVIAHRYGLFSIYAHNKSNSVKKGMRVHKGQVIGLLGKSGRATGPHLHFEIRRDGNPLDPIAIISKPNVNFFAKN